MRRILAALLALTFASLMARGAFPCDLVQAQPTCYVSWLPGPTRNTFELVSIEDQDTYVSTGQILLTTVAVDADLTLRDWVSGYFDPTVRNVDRASVFTDSRDEEQVWLENAVRMQQSQVEAAVAALSYLGLPDDPIEAGAEVVSVLGGSPASELGLAVGDVIRSVDGQRITSDQQLVSTMKAREIGAEVRLVWERTTTDDEGEVSVQRLEGSATLARSTREEGRAVLGVTVMTHLDLPIDIRVDAGSVGGPSGGLAFALTIIDLFGPDDLTSGHVVAVTGTIDDLGVVGPIGGVQQKVVGATERDGEPPATIFLIPRANFASAQQAAVSRPITLVPVETLDDAIAALRDLAADREPAGAVALGPTR